MSIAVAAVSGQPGLYAFHAPARHCRHHHRQRAGVLRLHRLHLPDAGDRAAVLPAASGYGQLLLTTATFGVGFLMRPVGGMLIGSNADRHGRRAAMTLTLWLMGLGCGLIALAPTYAQMGIAGPVIMVLARLIRASRPAARSARPPRCWSSTRRRRGAASQLAIRQPVAGRDAGRAGGGAADRRAHARADEGLGLARALRDRHPDRAGGRLYPPQPGRDAGAQPAPGAAHARSDHQPLRRVLAGHKGAVAKGILLVIGGMVCAQIIGFYMPAYANRNWACRPRPRCRPAWCWAPSVSWPRPSSACWPTAWDASA